MKTLLYHQASGLNLYISYVHVYKQVNIYLTQQIL